MKKIIKPKPKVSETTFNLIFFTIATILIFLLGCYMHERVHQEIFKGYGIESKMIVLWAEGSFAVQPEQNCPSEGCNLAHNINDAIGYNLQMFYVLIFAGFLLMLNKKEEKK